MTTESSALDTTAASALRKVRFDGTVNLGHILTFVGLIFIGFSAWTGMDKRVLVLEEDRRAKAELTAAKDQVLKEQLTGITAAISKVDERLQRFTERSKP